MLFASLPTGASAEALARVPNDVKIVDVGVDHRYAEGWTYGPADVWPAEIEGQTRVANPGCFPATTLTALALLLATKLIEPGYIVVDAKTGISGAGPGDADNRFGYAESNENLVIAMGVVDNLGKGAAGRAVQNANLICGLPETAGLDGAPVWP